MYLDQAYSNTPNTTAKQFTFFLRATYAASNTPAIVPSIKHVYGLGGSIKSGI